MGKYEDSVQHLSNAASPKDTVPLLDIIILDIGRDYDVLRRAVDSALAKLQLNITQRDGGVCYPYYAIAAQGASLRAIDWISYYDEEFAEAQVREEIDDDFEFDMKYNIAE